MTSATTVARQGPGMSAAAAGTLTTVAKLQLHPVYGNAVIGKGGQKLESFPLPVLNKWHEKALRLADEFFKSHTPEECDNSPEYDVLYYAGTDVLEAAYKAEVVGAHDLAALLQITNRHAADRDDVEAAIDLMRLNRLSASASEVAELPRPAKRLPATKRGSRLTKAGLLFRYQSFLVQELLTVSWHLHGSAEYAFSSIHFDHEVTKRCSPHFKNGKPSYRRGQKSHPFFDENKLPDRARSVLKSLKIDTDTAGERDR